MGGSRPRARALSMWVGGGGVKGVTHIYIHVYTQTHALYIYMYVFFYCHIYMIYYIHTNTPKSPPTQARRRRPSPCRTTRPRRSVEGSGASRCVSCICVYEKRMSRHAPSPNLYTLTYPGKSLVRAPKTKLIYILPPQKNRVRKYKERFAMTDMRKEANRRYTSRTYIYCDIYIHTHIYHDICLCVYNHTYTI